MLAEASGPSATPPPVAVIVALAAERAAFRASSFRLLHAFILQSGPGAARAAAAAEQALVRGAGALVSFGVAGGLSADAGPGTLLVPARVVGATHGATHYDTNAAWRERIIAALAGALPLSTAPLLASNRVLGTPAAKAAAAAASGAVAVDTESGALAAAALAAGVPFVAVRAVADGVHDTLPPGVDTWVDARGRARFATVAGAVCRPSNWSKFVTLAGRYGAARRTLEIAASRLGPAGFLLPPR